ncbi:MAG: gliding-motility protein MglA [Chloroflexi bacterium]|nr:MAG: gliding-motility protein MglA [Chloroflexota bacterium]RLC80273.1 MAG: gliding-motility protein MglA [Chloroflexota bacterium]
MFINWKLREINLKIVYYGPALSGKTTNLQYIHAKSNPKIRGDLVSLKTRGDRTLYFDFLQLELGQIAGLKPRFNLYTVPGQAYYISSRKLVLQGADGVVFVADSQTERLEANVEAARDMAENLHILGFDPQTMPLVLQCNKRDLPGVAPVSLIKRQFGFTGAPCLESVATQGNGVFDTLKTIINLVVAQAQQQL